MGKGLIEEVIDFYKTFDEYKDSLDQEIYQHLEPSFKLNQYKIFRDNQITGFVNWAYLNDLTKTKLINHGIIDYSNWNCGNNLCFADLLCRKNIRDMINWCKEHFGKQLGYDKEVVWVKTFKGNRTIRVNNNVKYC